MKSASEKSKPSSATGMTMTDMTPAFGRAVQVIGFGMPIALGWWIPWIDPTGSTPLLLVAGVVVASMLAGSWWALATFPLGCIVAAFTRVFVDDEAWLRLSDFIADWDGSHADLVLRLIEKAVEITAFVGVFATLGAGMLMALPIAAGIWLRSRLSDVSAPRRLSYWR